MTSAEADLEEQLKEAGNKLLSPPSSIDGLLNLLDVTNPFTFLLAFAYFPSGSFLLSEFVGMLV